MLMQLSSGDGPAECELAVEKCFAALQREFPEIVLTDRKAGSVRGGSGSIRFRVPEAAGEAVRGLRALSGTIQWICPSPLRPHHRRKNWFISLREINEAAGPDRSGLVRMDRFRSGGKGGQNVNKVETGVRLTHAGANISVRVTSQRSQLQNRREAEARLEAAFERLEDDARKETEADAWMKNKNLERGRAVRVYEGLSFRLRP